MTAPVICFSRKREAWLVYDRPGRREALLYAQQTHGQTYDAVERQMVTGCLPSVWTLRAGQFSTQEAAR